LRQAICLWFAHQYLGFNKRPYTLFQKEGIAFGAFDEHLFERLQARVVSQQGMQNNLRTCREQRIEAQLGIKRLAAPTMLILGTLIDQKQDLRRG
jgi:hypothetical protein